MLQIDPEKQCRVIDTFNGGFVAQLPTAEAAKCYVFPGSRSTHSRASILRRGTSALTRTRRTLVRLWSRTGEMRRYRRMNLDREMMMTFGTQNLPASLSEARRVGAMLYFTGKECKRKHVSPRRADTAVCVECHNGRSRANGAAFAEGDAMKVLADLREVRKERDALRKEVTRLRSVLRAVQRTVQSEVDEEE